jgi:hypothetical protein
MTLSAVKDLIDETSALPAPAEGDGRSSQTFLVDVVVRSGNDERRVTASGRDIYAFTAPLIAEAAERVVRTSPRAGVFSAGELFDARDFLQSLAPECLTLNFYAEVRA